MGGGTVYIPLLTQGLGVPQHLAQWLNLVAFVPMASISLIIHAKNKLLDKKRFWTLLIPSALSAVTCSVLAVKVAPRTLGIAFAFFLVSAGVWGLVATVRKALLERERNTPKEPADSPEEM